MPVVVEADHPVGRLERLEPAVQEAVETEQTPVQERQELPTQAVVVGAVAQGLAPVVRAQQAAPVSSFFATKSLFRLLFRPSHLPAHSRLRLA